jgi:hypothetical protein
VFEVVARTLALVVRSSDDLREADQRHLDRSAWAIFRFTEPRSESFFLRAKPLLNIRRPVVTAAAGHVVDSAAASLNRAGREAASWCDCCRTAGAMILGTCATFAVARIVPSRKFLPIARQPSLHENAADIRAVNKTLRDDTVAVCRRRLSVARGAAAHLNAFNLLALDESLQGFGRLVIARTTSFRSINAAQPHVCARAAVAQHDVVSIDGARLAGKLGSITSRDGNDPKNRKSRAAGFRKSYRC